jgi:hypothetical protein
LKPEITDDVGLIGTRRLQAAPDHQEEDHRAMDLVASAHASRGLAFGGMESALGIEFYVLFEVGGEIVADNKTTEPAVRSFVDELITDFVIHPDGAESPGEFEGQEESIARRSDAPADRIVRVVDKELGKTEMLRPDSPAS